MNISRSLIIFFGIFLISGNIQSQSNDNHPIVKRIYDVLQDQSVTTKKIKDLTPEVKWDHRENLKDYDRRTTITLNEILKNKWRKIEFKDLNFQKTDKNEVIVTGIVSGRQPTECEYISNRFKHQWFLEDGKIISFRE